MRLTNLYSLFWSLAFGLLAAAVCCAAEELWHAAKEERLRREQQALTVAHAPSASDCEQLLMLIIDRFGTRFAMEKLGTLPLARRKGFRNLVLKNRGVLRDMSK